MTQEHLNNLLTQVNEYLEHETESDMAEILKDQLNEAHDSTVFAQLTDAFSQRLPFGTAGIRGAVGPGPNRMNMRTVAATAWGVFQYFSKQADDEKQLKCLIAHDARQHSSKWCAGLVNLLKSLGAHVTVFETHVPTPLAAYAMRICSADIGFIITASHNPPADNGLKIYMGNSAQLIPPHDHSIASKIDQAPSNQTLVSYFTKQADADVVLGEEMRSQYLDAILAYMPPTSENSPLCICYSAMHGVGAELIQHLCDALPGIDLRMHPTQSRPDPTFPGLAFPNPEEDGALDALCAYAEEQQAELILANDPDADRLSVGEYTEKGLRIFTGNELGCLFAHHTLSRVDRKELAIIATTCVSTQLVGRIAKHFGAHYIETLTGFKWIANLGIERESTMPGSQFLFGFEEAIGFTFGPLVRDKDGVHAAKWAIQLKQQLKLQGMSLEDYLHQIHDQFGRPRASAWSRRFDTPNGAQTIKRVMTHIRQNPLQHLLGHEVEQMEDFGARTEAHLKTNMLVFRTKEGDRLIIRPSGTEPKVKFYYESLSSTDMAEHNWQTTLREEVERHCFATL